jgi:hypothetical protein
MRNRASCFQRQFATIVCAILLLIVCLSGQSSAANLKSPVLYSVSAASTRAIALETVS